MSINAMHLIRIVTLTILCLLYVGQPIEAIPSTESEIKAADATGQKIALKDSNEDQVTVKLSRDEVDSIALALPEGETKQMFNKKFTKGKEMKDDSFDESLRSGEEISLFFFEGEKAFSRAQRRIFSFFAKPTSTFDTHE